MGLCAPNMLLFIGCFRKKGSGNPNVVPDSIQIIIFLS